MFWISLLFCLQGGDKSCKPLIFPTRPYSSMDACVEAVPLLSADLLARRPELEGYVLRFAACENEVSPKSRRA